MSAILPSGMLAQTTASRSSLRPIFSRPVQSLAQPSQTASFSAGRSTKQAPAVETSSRAYIADQIPHRRQNGPHKTQQLTTFLQRELAQMYSTGVITQDHYAEDFCFSDPIVRIQGKASYAQSLRLLTTAFDIKHTVHSTSPGSGPEEIVTRWTFSAKVKAAPWQQNFIFTGRSFYRVNNAGLLQDQRDVWDAVHNNDYLSVEGIQHVMKMALKPMHTPDLDTPRYQVLKRMCDYEIRCYPQFLTAEVPMPSGSSPASGTGFNELAGYIFGGNAQKERMEMTTPVFTTAGQNVDGGKMAFVMEARMGNDPLKLPLPADSRVQRMVEDSKIMAALPFSGLPLDNEVVEAERHLRGALLLDGLIPDDGYKLARYNDPFTLPFLRRNEILIVLKDYKLD